MSDIKTFLESQLNVDKEIFSPVKNIRAFEEVSSKIKTLIFEGVLKSGDRLPSESELAKQFHVGRQTVREALRILELSGLVTVQKGFGGGPIIKDKISGKITNLLLDAFQMDKITVEEFTAARMVIEKAIVNNAIDNAEDEDIKNLQENLAQAKALIAKKEFATNLNFDFHSLLAKASKNKVFIILEGAINEIHRDLRSRSTVDLKTSKKAFQAHEKILNALIQKERDKAIDLIEKHILGIEKSLK